MTRYSAATRRTPAIPGLVTEDHWLTVPLDWARPDEATIRLYAREVREAGPAAAARPWLVFLQGGPGGKGPRPSTTVDWIGHAARHYRVLLLDQRGTGRSTPITPAVAAGLSASALADRLALMRADSIVRDAEAYRSTLGGSLPWTALGQSFGGFCVFTYLSIAAHGLTGAMVTGGIPPLGCTARQVYEVTWPIVQRANLDYRERFPGDQQVLEAVREHLLDSADSGSPVRLPGGDELTVARLQATGMALGDSGALLELHYALEEAFDGTGALTPTFLTWVEAKTSMAAAPLFAAVHEASYADGPGSTGWAATAAREAFPAFAVDAPDLLLTGEVIERWRYHDEAAMRPFAEAADLLAERTDWPGLYDLDRLSRNEVPVAAVVYHDDLYVDPVRSLEVADRTPGVRVWQTSEYLHNGLRADPAVFDRVHRMLTEVSPG